MENPELEWKNQSLYGYADIGANDWVITPKLIEPIPITPTTTFEVEFKLQWTVSRPNFSELCPRNELQWIILTREIFRCWSWKLQALLKFSCKACLFPRMSVWNSCGISSIDYPWHILDICHWSSPSIFVLDVCGQTPNSIKIISLLFK